MRRGGGYRYDQDREFGSARSSKRNARLAIGFKIFGIAVGAADPYDDCGAAGHADDAHRRQSATLIDQNYFPAYVALAQANICSVEESAYVRRLILASAERPRTCGQTRRAAAADREHAAKRAMKRSPKLADTSMHRSPIHSILMTTLRWPG